MFAYIAEITKGEIKIDPPVRFVTQNDLMTNGFKMMADAAFNKLVYPHNLETLTVGELQQTDPVLWRKVNILTKGVNLILKGLEFTAVADREGNLTAFTIASVSRPGRIYSVSEYGCQCEGFENHSVCYHTMLRPLFQDYFYILRAHEAFRIAHAKIGMSLIPQDSIKVPKDFSSREIFDDLFHYMKNLPVPPPGFRGM